MTRIKIRIAMGIEAKSLIAKPSPMRDVKTNPINPHRFQFQTAIAQIKLITARMTA
jgi:hypothetical protein